MDRRTLGEGRGRRARHEAERRGPRRRLRDGEGGGVETFYSSSDYDSQLRRFRARFSNRDIQFHIRPRRAAAEDGKEGENGKRKRAINKTSGRRKEGVEQRRAAKSE